MNSKPETRNTRPLLAIVYLLSVILAGIDRAAKFTSSFTITETNLTYEAQDIVMSGATLRNLLFVIRKSLAPSSPTRRP